MAQICAEALGVDYRRVRVIHGQTDRAAFGIGAHASRATVLTGNAVNVTALKLRDKALAYASELLQTATGELDIVDGVVVTRGIRSVPRSRSPTSRAASRLAPGCSATASPGSARKAGTTRIVSPSPMAFTSRSSGSIVRPAGSRSNAMLSPRRWAAPSIRC